jgi:30S ribosomal protein S31
MGKGDKRSKRGKITIGSYGKTRPKKTAAKVTAAPAPAPVAKTVTKKKKA